MKHRRGEDEMKKSVIQKREKRALSFIIATLLVIALPGPAALGAPAPNGGNYNNAITNAVKWLEVNQNTNGSFGNSMQILETSEVITLVSASAFSSPNVTSRASSWLKTQQDRNNDDLFRMLGVPDLLAGRGFGEILDAQKDDGGWGISAGYQSDVFDTILALDALMNTSLTENSAASRGVSYLLNSQNPDGGWSYADDGKSSVYLSAHAFGVIQNFKSASRQPGSALEIALFNGRQFLMSSVDTEGTWGLSRDAVKATIFACAALKYSDSDIFDMAVEKLVAIQHQNGSLYESPSLTARLIWLLGLPDKLPVITAKIIKDIEITAPEHILAYDDMQFLPVLEGFYELTMDLLVYVETPDKRLIPLDRTQGRYPWNTGQNTPGIYNVVVLIRDRETEEYIDIGKKTFEVEDSFAVTRLDITFDPQYYRLGIHYGVMIGLNVQTESNISQVMTAMITVLSEDKSEVLLQHSESVVCGGVPDSLSLPVVLFSPEASEPAKYVVNAVLRAQNAEGNVAQRILEIYPPPPDMSAELDWSVNKNALMPGGDDIELTFQIESFGSVPEGTPNRTYGTSADFDEGTLINVVIGQDGVSLDETTKPFHFVWIANSTKGTVMKINAVTCEVVGEYWTSPQGQPRDPSRTTVDHDGNVWVANRAGNSVTKIGLMENGGWADKNGDGVCQTSTGLNDILPWTNAGGADTDGAVSGSTGTSTAADECILLYVRVSASGTRHLCIDQDNNLWVSGIGTNRGRFDLIDSKTGIILRTEGPPSGASPAYGGLMDRNGIIWSSNGSAGLLRWDPALPLTGSNGGNWDYYNVPSYGLAMDSNGNVWTSSYGNGVVTKFAPDGTRLGTYGQHTSNVQGLCSGLDDDIWLAGNTVGRIKNNGAMVGTVTGLTGVAGTTGQAVGIGAIGVAVDANGFIWSAGNSGWLCKIDPNAGPIGSDGATPRGQVIWAQQIYNGAGTTGGLSTLYNYSDMTGSTLSAPPNRGTWAAVYDSGQDGTEWGFISWEADTPGDSNVEAFASSSVDGTNFSDATRATNGKAFDLPPGRYIKIEMRLIRSSEDESPIIKKIEVSAKALSGLNATLALTIPAGVAPTVIDTVLAPAPGGQADNPDGSTSAQWHSPKLFFEQTLDYRVSYHGENLLPDTAITLAHGISLTYTDLSGAVITRTLEPIAVKVNPSRVLGEISLNKPVYNARENAQISIKVKSYIEPPKTLTGTVEIVDGNGALVALLDEEIELRDELSKSYIWNTGNLLSGTYGARLRIYDGAALACETTERFILLPEGGFTNGIYSEKPIYYPETVAVLHDLVENTFRNYYPGRVTDTITVRDKAGNLHFIRSFELGNLYVSSRDVTAQWDIGRVLPGEYVAQAVIREDGVIVAQSECTIEIASTGSYAFAGKLNLPQKTVRTGQSVPINYDIENIGDAEADTAFAVITVLDPDDLTSVHQTRTGYNLPIGTKRLAGFSVPSSLLKEGDYLVIYTVEADGALYPMQSNGFSVIGGRPASSRRTSQDGDTEDIDDITPPLGKPYDIECINSDTGDIIYTATDVWGDKEVYHVFAPRIPGWILIDESDFQTFYHDNVPGTVYFYYREDTGGIHESYLYGYPDLTVRPDGQITRGEAAAMMYRLIRHPDKERFTIAERLFADTGGCWAETEIEYLAYIGLVAGYPDGTYRPDKFMSREELIALLVRYANYLPDVIAKTGSGGWSGNYVDTAVSSGYINGFPDSTLRLEEKITRAQTVTILNRIWNRAYDKNYVMEQKLIFTDITNTHWSYADIVEASITHEYLRDGTAEILVKQ